MLSGNDFIILTHVEAELMYNALRITKSKATYKELQDLGILSLVQDLGRFLYPEEGD